MLHFHTLSNAAEAKAYFRGADYMYEGAEKGAYWLGKGAEMLHLEGSADQDHFERLIDNLHPFYDVKLTAARRADRDFARDMTVSIVKSATLAATIGEDERIPAAAQRAISRMFAVMERDASTRVRKGGVEHDRTTGNLVACVFPHATSRPIKGQPDPQLHWHVVILNLTFDREENEWKAVQFRPLLKDSGYYNALFRSYFAQELGQLGYTVKRTKDAFELVGIPDRSIREFSRRTGLIEKTAELLGVKRPETKAKLGATTREKKTAGLSWDDLLGLWTERLQDGDLEAIQQTVAGATGPASAPDRTQEAVDFALAHLFERNSVVDERQIVAEALRHGVGGTNGEAVYKEIGSRQNLIRRRIDGREMITTKEVLAEERKIVAFAQKGRGRFRPLSPAIPSTAVSDLTTLSPSQQAAIRHVWHSRDPLMLVRGAAGTGKTTMTRALLAGVDVPWVILAPSAQASRGVLRSEGFGEQADTLAKFLLDEEFQEKARGGLIVLDEASMAGAHDLARLIQVADSLHARVILLGDRRQHKSVARGDVLALLEDKAGLPVAEVAEIKRQAGEYKAAVKLASEGRVSEAFGKLDKLGWVREGGLVDDYMAAMKDGKSVLVVSPTHVQGDKVTAAIREWLKQEGRLTGEERAFDTLVPLQWTAAERGIPGNYQPGDVLQFHRAGGSGVKAGDRRVVEAGEDNARVTRPAGGVAPSGSDRDQVLLEDHCRNPAVFGAYRPAVLGISAGDAIRITANGKTLDGKHRLNNGAVYTVDDFTDSGNILLNNGWVLSKDYGHLAHGYVSTSHASQGRTVDRVLIDMPVATFPAVGKEQFYVSVSRGKQQARVYTDDREALLDAIEREDTRLLASELVKAPRKNILKQLKRRVSFLRELAAHTKVRVHEIIRPRVREMHHER